MRAGVIAVVLLLAGCSAPAPAPAGSESPEAPSPYLTVAIGVDGPGTAPGPGIFPIVPATHAHVQLTCPLISAVHYDADAIPPSDVERIYTCTTEPYLDAPDGTPQIAEFVDRVAEDDLAGLLDAYAVADAEPTDAACTLELRDPLIIWLHHDDQITPAYAPRDECAMPSAAAADAYASVELHRVLVAREKLKR